MHLPREPGSPKVAPGEMRAMAQPPRSATTMPPRVKTAHARGTCPFPLSRPESTNMQGSCSTQPSTTTVCPCLQGFRQCREQGSKKAAPRTRKAQGRHRYIAEVTRAFKASRKPVLPTKGSPPFSKENDRESDRRSARSTRRPGRALRGGPHS